jgi:hypothetical protein
VLGSSPFPAASPLIRRAPGLGFGLRHLLGNQAGTAVLLVLVVVAIVLVIWSQRRR